MLTAGKHVPASVANRKLPRTNAAACEWWADAILLREPREHRTVNSIRCRGDVIYSFGTHFPMAKLIRDKRGRVVRVVINSDYYPGGGWGKTHWDQSNVRRECLDRIARAGWKIRVDEVPLSQFGYQANRLRLRPDINDPEPDPYPRTVVEPFFFAFNPGPEPVKSPDGCIAGEREEFSYVERHFMRRDRLRPTDWIVPTRYRRADDDYVYVDRAYNGGIEWVEKLDYRSHSGREGWVQKVCPHCAEFNARHERWRTLMHGGWDFTARRNGTYRGRSQRIKGYKRYRELMVQFGGEKGWREARLRDFRRVRRLKKVREAWEARNFVSLSDVPTDRHGIPIIDRDGFVPRAPVERLRRERERVEARRQRERERQRRAHERAVAKRRREIEAARKAWQKGFDFEIRGEVADWCLRHGLAPNDDQTVTLVKAVYPDGWRSGYGFAYEPGTTVTAPDYNTSRSCGGGLHFGPDTWTAQRYHGSADVVHLRCRVPLATLIPLDDKCKAQSCYVEGVIAND